MSKVKRKATASGSSSAPSSPSSAHGGTLISPEDALREFAEHAFLSSDATFVDTFLLTYRTFQSDEGSSVLALWAQRYVIFAGWRGGMSEAEVDTMARYI